MESKIAVQLPPMQSKSYCYSYLFYCKRCGAYTTLGEELCSKCGHHQYMDFGAMGEALYKKQKQIEWLIWGSIFALSFLLAGVFSTIQIHQMIGGTLGMFVSAIGLWFIQKQYKEDRIREILYDILQSQPGKISSGIERDLKEYETAIQEKQYPEAYVKLRNIGTILKNDMVKLEQLSCLRKFVLRSDMPLEMDDLLPAFYHPLVPEYIYEISRLQRSMIKQKAIEYILACENEVLRDFSDAKRMLGAIGGCVIYNKRNVEVYQDFLIRYMEYIPKERLLRLQKMLQKNTLYDWKRVQEKFEDVIRQAYKGDTDFGRSSV